MKAKLKLSVIEAKKLGLATELAGGKVLEVKSVAGELRALVQIRSNEDLFALGKYIVSVSDTDVTNFNTPKDAKKETAKK